MARISVIAGLVAAVGGLLASESAVAQDASPANSVDPSLNVIKPKSVPEPIDRLANAAEVSAARIVVGVMIADVARPEQLSIVAELPRSWVDETVCARLISPDALYEGRAEYLVQPETGSPFAQLEFRSGHWETLQERGADQLAIAVTRGACDAAAHEFVPAALTASAPSKRTAWAILVNSQGAERVFAEITAPSTFRGSFSCDQPQGQSGVGYDHICRIEFGTPPVGEKVDIRINRMSFGAFEKPIDLSVHIAADN